MPYTTFDPPLEFDGTPERAELNNRIINLQLEREAALADRDRLAAELAAIRQAIADPENQPSQFGTVPLSAYDQVRHDLDNARACYIRGDADRLQLKRNLAISRKWARRWKAKAKNIHYLAQMRGIQRDAAISFANREHAELARARAVLAHLSPELLRDWSIVIEHAIRCLGCYHDCTTYCPGIFPPSNEMAGIAAALEAAAQEMER